MIWTSERLDLAITELGISGYKLAELAETHAPTVSDWRTGRRAPTEEVATRVQTVLEDLRAIRAKHVGIAVSMDDTEWLREEIRKLRQNRLVPQEFGLQFIDDFCARNGFVRPEFLALAQFRPSLVHAEILSAPAQRWAAAWSAGIESELAGRQFSVYAAESKNRLDALVRLGDRVFSALLQEVGKQKIMEYLAGLMATGELRHSAAADN